MSLYELDLSHDLIFRGGGGVETIVGYNTWVFKQNSCCGNFNDCICLKEFLHSCQSVNQCRTLHLFLKCWRNLLPSSWQIIWWEIIVMWTYVMDNFQSAQRVDNSTKSMGEKRDVLQVFLVLSALLLVLFILLYFLLHLDSMVVMEQ